MTKVVTENSKMEQIAHNLSKIKDKVENK